MLDGFAVLRIGYLRLLLWPNHRLIRARCTVYCPCEEIPREPFEPFGTSSPISHLNIHLDLISLVPSVVREKETFLPSCFRETRSNSIILAIAPVLINDADVSSTS